MSIRKPSRSGSSPRSRRNAYRFNGDRLRLELAKRGLSQERFAQVADVTAATVLHAVAGRPLSPTTLNKITTALVKLPVLPGADDLVVAHEYGS